MRLTETATSGRRWRRSYRASQQSPRGPHAREPGQAKKHEKEGCLLRCAQLTRSHVDHADHQSLERQSWKHRSCTKTALPLRPSPGHRALAKSQELFELCSLLSLLCILIHFTGSQGAADRQESRSCRVSVESTAQILNQKYTRFINSVQATYRDIPA